MRGGAVYKVVWFARFLAGSDREEARRHWREIHGPLGREVPQIETYVQSHATQALGPAGPSDDPLGFDGYSCCWYPDEGRFLESLRTPEWAAISADGPNLFDMDWFWGMSAILDERTIVDGEYGPLKAVWVVRFRDEIRRDPERTREAHEYWIGTHGGRYGRDVPGIGRYVQNHCVAPLGVDGADESIELGFDGFSECWFEDRAAFDRAMSSPEWLAMNEDAENLFDVAWIVGGMSALLEENVVKGRRELAHA
jgi:uncharacterized protein (TIGR02118 family)